MLLLLGMVICAIVDMAISGTLSWSLIPISACILAGLVFTPIFKYGFRGIIVALVAFSVLIVPFLFILSLLVDANELLLPFGIRISAVCIIYLWSMYVLFKTTKVRELIATAILLLITIPFSLTINLILAGFIDQPLIDVWDVLTFSIIVASALALLGIDYYMQKRKRLNNKKTRF